MVDSMLNKINEEHGLDLSKNKNTISKLRQSCKDAKQILSSTFNTTIFAENIIDGDDFEYDLTRGEFESICEPIFDRCIPPIEKAIAASGFTRDEIDDVIMVGGCSRIPKLKERVQAFFNGKRLNQQLSPDEAICQGATIYAGKIAGHPELQDL